jgi:hypothetical protein
MGGLHYGVILNVTEVKRMGGLHYGVILIWMLGGRRRRNCLLPNGLLWDRGSP